MGRRFSMSSMKSVSGRAGGDAFSGGKRKEPLAEHISGAAASARLMELAGERAAEADYLGAVALIKQGADIRARDAEGKTAHDRYAEYCAKNPDHEFLCYPNSALLEAVLRKGDIFADPDFNPAHFA